MTRTASLGTLAADLRVAIGRTARRIRTEKSDLDLSDTQMSVLFLLDRDGATTPGELAEHERVQPPSMTKVVNALADRGLVQRSDHPDDRRQVLITVTEAGRTEVRETRRRRDAWLAKRLADLTPDERATLAAASTLLRRIAAS
jgi:DNA-binding MarR family transcriptional regulator